MSKQVPKQVTIDVEAWRRNLRRARDEPNMDDDALKRWVNNYFAFWAICATGACRRNKRCAGDPKSCHDRIWPHVPERMKFEFRAYLKAADDGLSVAEARRKVAADWARYEPLLANSGQAVSRSSPLPLAEEGGRERSERPGEGHSNGKEPSPASLATLAQHPLPQAGEGKGRAAGGPRVRIV